MGLNSLQVYRMLDKVSWCKIRVNYKLSEINFDLKVQIYLLNPFLYSQQKACCRISSLLFLNSKDL